MSKFRNHLNQRICKQLFYDMWINMVDSAKTYKPIYTLHHDKEGYINFRTEYLSDEDPTGYRTSQRLLENYDHWLMLMKLPWFVKAKEIWDVELEARLKSKAAKIFENIATDIDLKPSERISAARALLDLHGAKGTSKRTAGRPSKEEVEGELKNQARAEKEFEDDLARIREVKKKRG